MPSNDEADRMASMAFTRQLRKQYGETVVTQEAAEPVPPLEVQLDRMEREPSPPSPPAEPVDFGVGARPLHEEPPSMSRILRGQFYGVDPRRV